MKLVLADQQEKIIVIGKLGKPFGIKGWLKLHSYTDPADNIFQYTPWLMKIRDEWHEVSWEQFKITQNLLTVKFAQFATPEDAKSLTNGEIAVIRQQLPPLKNDEYYWSDLAKLQVCTATGITLGNIEYLFAAGSHPVVVVKGKREYLIPFVSPQVIKKIDLQQKMMIVDWDPE